MSAPADQLIQQSWPRILERRNGTYVVRGRYFSRWCFKLWRAVFVTALRCLGLYVLLAAACIPSLIELDTKVVRDRHSALSDVVVHLTRVRLAAHRLVVDDYPSIGELLGYQSAMSPYDWRLLAVAIIAFVAARPLAALLCLMAWPLVTSTLKVSITDEAVVLHGWFRRIRLDRAAADITFRSCPLHQVRPVLALCLQRRRKNPPHAESRDPNVVVLSHGLSYHQIAAQPLYERRSEMICAALHTALRRSQPTFAMPSNSAAMPF